MNRMRIGGVAQLSEQYAPAMFEDLRRLGRAAR
jgi:hypothetical protein